MFASKRLLVSSSKTLGKSWHQCWINVVADIAAATSPALGRVKFFIFYF